MKKILLFSLLLISLGSLSPSLSAETLITPAKVTQATP
jgi:hypothetical protein